MAQDDYYYEIQLTNKQLVFYFMAGAAGLILSFLAGVMVGRGVDTAANASDQPEPITQGRVISEQPEVTPAPDDFSYPRTLESEEPVTVLERRGPASTTSTPAPTPVAKSTPRPTPKATPTPPPTPRSTPARATQPLPAPLPAGSNGHVVQVGAFKDKASADSVMNGLKAKGFPAYVDAPAPQSGGLFTVRVGPYRDRADADVVAARLTVDKFKPYIVKQ